MSVSCNLTSVAKPRDPRRNNNQSADSALHSADHCWPSSFSRVYHFTVPYAHLMLPRFQPFIILSCITVWPAVHQQSVGWLLTSLIWQLLSTWLIFSRINHFTLPYSLMLILPWFITPFAILNNMKTIISFSNEENVLIFTLKCENVFITLSSAKQTPT